MKRGKECILYAESISKLGDKNIRVRQKPEKELVEIGKPAVQLLIHALEDENWRARWRAANALGKIGDARAVEPLIQRLSDCLPVQIRAAVALGKIGKPAVEPLLGILGDNHYAVRETIAISLTKLREPIVGSILRRLKVESRFIHDGRFRSRERKRYSATLEPLTRALRRGDAPARIAVAVALGMIGGPRPVEPLTHALNDKNKDVRMAAVQSLGKIGQTRALKSALNHRSPEVRLHFYVTSVQWNLLSKL